MDALNADLILMARTLLATALGFAIGWERERHGSPAGDRTYAMIALGSAAFTAVGVDSFPATAEKLIAGVVTGVGFLGAGVIMRTGSGEVRGLTTAASIWAVAAVGVIVGAGDYIMGTVIAMLIMLLLSWEQLPLLRRVGHPRRRESAREEIEAALIPGTNVPDADGGSR